MINFKQMELGRSLFEKLANQFPEIRLVNISESADNPNHVWINIVMPENDEREMEIRQTASEISTDILLEYGYHITISSAEKAGRMLLNSKMTLSYFSPMVSLMGSVARN